MEGGGAARRRRPAPAAGAAAGAPHQAVRLGCATWHHNVQVVGSSNRAGASRTHTQLMHGAGLSSNCCHNGGLASCLQARQLRCMAMMASNPWAVSTALSYTTSSARRGRREQTAAGVASSRLQSGSTSEVRVVAPPMCAAVAPRSCWLVADTGAARCATDGRALRQAVARQHQARQARAPAEVGQGCGHQVLCCRPACHQRLEGQRRIAAGCICHERHA